MGSAMAYAAVAIMAVHRNDLRRADEYMARAFRMFPDAPPEFVGHWLHWAQALLLEAQGDPVSAFRVLASGWRRRVQAGVLIDHPVVGPDFVRLACAAGRPESATVLVDQVTDAAHRLGTPTARGASLRCRGLLEKDAALLAEAVVVLRAGARPLDLARACEEASDTTPSKQHAAELLEEAVVIYENLGAVRDVARVEARLRALGVRRGQRGSRRRKSAAGWDSLTRTETQVVGLVAEGLTNAEVGQRLFISPRTVECHLSHVFSKLGLTSRAVLRSEAARRGVGRHAALERPLS